MEEHWSLQLELARSRELELKKDLELSRVAADRINNPFYYPIILRFARFLKGVGTDLEVKYEKKVSKKVCA